jgi:hypothetical protein
MSVPAHRTVKKQIYSDNSDIEITFTLTIRRKTLFYTFNLSKKKKILKPITERHRILNHHGHQPNFNQPGRVATQKIYFWVATLRLISTRLNI